VDDAFRGISADNLKYDIDGHRTLAKGTQFKALEAEAYTRPLLSST
jgi:hypothetical protein